MFLDYLKYILNNIGHRKMRTWLTMIGIFIGITAVVSLIGLGEGLRNAITSQFGFVGADILTISAKGGVYGLPGAGAAIPLTDDLADKISKINGVDVVFNRYVHSIKVEFNNKQDLRVAGSVIEGDNRKAFETMINLKTEKGRLLRDSDTRGVLLGNNFKESDNNFGKAINVGDKILLNDVSYKVIGIVEKKGNFMVDGGIFVNENDIFNLGAKKEQVSAIAVKVRNIKNIENVQEDVEKLLRKERNVKKGEEDFTIQTPQKAIETLDSTLFAVQLFIYIIAGISLLVGGIGIANTMYTTVLERRKEIGIMKAIGAKNSTIFMMFSMESGFLGAVGGAIGVLFGLMLAYGLAFIGSMVLGSGLIQAKVSLMLIFGALCFSFFIGTAAGVLPAMQASKLQPVESLRSAL